MEIVDRRQLMQCIMRRSANRRCRCGVCKMESMENVLQHAKHGREFGGAHEGRQRVLYKAAHVVNKAWGLVEDEEEDAALSDSSGPPRGILLFTLSALSLEGLGWLLLCLPHRLPHSCAAVVTSIL